MWSIDAGDGGGRRHDSPVRPGGGVEEGNQAESIVTGAGSGYFSRDKPTSNGHVRLTGGIITRIIFSSSPGSSHRSSLGSSSDSSPG